MAPDKIDIASLCSMSLWNAFLEPPNTTQEDVARKERQTHKELTIGQRRRGIAGVEDMIAFFHDGTLDVARVNCIFGDVCRKP